jgi:predicted DsbA family dithiol-disulfide isomerase
VARVELEIWSDIACPWCYIGKRRLEAALAQFDHADQLTITWRSFELDPAAPAEHEGDHAERLARKYAMSVERAREIQAQMTEAAGAEGLRFDFEAVRGGSTFDAHRLVHLAAAHGRQDAMKERLLGAYFSEGRLISDAATLLELAEEIGLPRAEAAELLAGQRYQDEVRADERAAAGLGISGVPTFIVDRRVGVTGAQPPELLLEMLRRGWAEREPTHVVSVGESCDLDGC